MNDSPSVAKEIGYNIFQRDMVVWNMNISIDNMRTEISTKTSELNLAKCTIYYI